MKLQTTISLHSAKNQIGYESQVLILGSCFAENIGSKLDYFKFQSFQNPFGILFHPLAIAKLISKAVKKETYSEDDIFFLNERWHCFDAHSDVSKPSKENLLEELNSGLENMYEEITKATHVLITLGTAWVYRNIATDGIVANCHKVPQKEFSKELQTVEEIRYCLRDILENVQAINKKAKFIFTVSPVRHLKDGFVESQRSKAHLISAVHQIIQTSHFALCTSYFPSYEIMMDELRDYRFYKTDMVHPNQLAIDYIWEKFKKVWISPDTFAVLEKVESIQKGVLHRPFNASSESHQQFLKSLGDKIAYLQQEYPHMKFGE